MGCDTTHPKSLKREDIRMQKSTQEDHHLRRKAMSGVMLLQAKICPILPVTYKKHEKRHIGLSKSLGLFYVSWL